MSGFSPYVTYSYTNTPSAWCFDGGSLLAENCPTQVSYHSPRRGGNAEMGHYPHNGYNAVFRRSHRVGPRFHASDAGVDCGNGEAQILVPKYPLRIPKYPRAGVHPPHPSLVSSTPTFRPFLLSALTVPPSSTFRTGGDTEPIKRVHQS